MSHTDDPKLPENPNPASPDYREDMDVVQVHAAILRERNEPREGYEPLSMWLFAGICALIFWAGAYLFYYSGDFRSDIFSPTQPTHIVRVGAEAVNPVKEGEKLFKANCMQCHQANGMGQAGMYPPLAGSEWVNGSAKVPAAIILKGLQGPIEAAGVKINSAMPGLEAALKDEQISYILTYVRQAWGNKGTAVTKEEVAAVREKIKDHAASWSPAEVKKFGEE